VSPGLGLPSPRGPVAALRVGITLPQFRLEPDAAVATARRAEEAGLDGVFVFDHLWPLGSPERPALHSFTLLGALAAETSSVTLGTLVARVGLVPDAVLVHSFETLHRMLGERLIAAVGTGDSGNKPENLAYGVPFAPVADRLDRMRACLTELRLRGITAWAGGNSPAVRRVASDSADAWNGWGRSADAFLDDAADVDTRCDVKWGGQLLVGADDDHAAELLDRHGRRDGLVHGSVDDLADHLRALAAGGTTWAVCAPIDIGADITAVDRVVAARDAARRALA
jgi:alkanesulfonate monooxygenase SsuD/methylene tetrahydromethanopterin reductase-like flavin-dependent oxidoreductase (luciferase family)